MRGNKYKNCKVKTQEGLGFDSRKEYFRYLELLDMQSRGEIKNLETQKTYQLLPKQVLDTPRFNPKTGKNQRSELPVTYTADFVYVTKDGRTVVEDTKSPATRTQQYIIRRKLMKFIHNIEIVEI